MESYSGYLIGICLSIISFAIQTWPRFANRYFGVDTWRHLEMADYIRVNKALPKENKKYIFSEPSDYPPMLRVVLAALPRKKVEQWQWFLSPAFDTLHCFILFLVGWVLTSSFWGGAIAQITYILSPLVVMENSNLTTRSFASFLSSLTFFSYVCFWAYGSYWFYIVALIFGILLILTHRFSLQAFLFLSIGLMVVSRSMQPILFLALSFGGAVLISGGYSWRVFTGHIKMLEFWRRNIHNRYAHQVRGLPKQSNRNESGDIVFRIYSLIRKMPFIAIFTANPSCIVPLVIGAFLLAGIISPGALHMDEPVWSYLITWSVTLTVAGLLIRQFQIFEFIGEGERYQDSGIFPAALVTSQAVLSFMNTEHRLLVLIGLSAIWIFGLCVSLYLQWNVVYKDHDRSIKEELWHIFDLINTQPDSVRLMTLPLLLADSAMYFSKAVVLSTDSSVAHLKHYGDFFPVIKGPVDDLIRKYAISHLLINLNYVKIEELKLHSDYVILHSGNFCLLKISNN
jgi:hypothetical protein